ncbi:hypothetical protein GLOTRDRAFT_79932 [Gloeophyllum trabeum ATCC 11539]|uniref:MICOS complex subunit MIC60 n=1 Tax=Gloeophyllum trabeum (strain ATCC 11539 / FP-39264 / Madison 617) TaxID=670483 RepID=S7PZP4_GLOTA|nr:uncharacterized protein GLOTRDRAFT_79932 [Gloeophyllum trabeum ATCC 11539]EPQ52767.1 hypothetical protein GLOTRDRAFT_79932 [Gloeophyllum trabeum ATCC 11539]
MYRAWPVTRQLVTRNVGGCVKVVRRRLATEAEAAPQPPLPKKKKSVIRRLLFWSGTATATFYVGSVFVAFKDERYYDFFSDHVPFGASFIQYAEDHDWDTLTVQNLVDSGKRTVDSVQRRVTGAAKEAEQRVEKAKDAVSADKAKALIQSTATAGSERIKAVTDSLRTNVRKSEEKVVEGGRSAAAAAKHQALQFSSEVEDLVRKAEAALAGKPVEPLPQSTMSPGQHGIAPQESASSEAETDKKIYEAPLPVGFEPPPGFSRPAPPKRAEPTRQPEAPPAPPPLPLVAPAVAELQASEPIITHLASTIDNLASYLNANPTAANEARDVLDNAKMDLTQLVSHMEKIKEQERSQLEAKLDEQTREYSLKLLEMEMEAQDKLDNQEQGFKQWFEQERQKFVKAYREKLEKELQTQSELINERLKEEVIAQGIELQRRWIREIKVRVEQERGGRLAKLDTLAANLKQLERVALDNTAYLDENLRVHALWSALRAVNHVLESPVRKPFREELRVLRHVAAAKEDDVIATALDTIERTDVPDIGVEPLPDLVTWFTTSVAPRVTSVALVPDEGTPGLLPHLASHFLSTFTFRRQGFAQGNDVLSTLARAEYYLNEKDLDSAARELNQLKGTPKMLVQDWLEAARRRLEVQQALEVAQAEATLASLFVV